jgi:hypothetical protein
MSKWIWDGGWTAHRSNPDGTVTVEKFTTTAAARQHVEKANSVTLGKRVRKHRPKRKHNRVSGKVGVLDASQKALKAEALKQFVVKGTNKLITGAPAKV